MNGRAVKAVVARLGEPIQVDTELLGRLASAGVLPGSTISVERGDGVLTIHGDGDQPQLDLHDDISRHIFVVAR